MGRREAFTAMTMPAVWSVQPQRQAGLAVQRGVRDAVLGLLREQQAPMISPIKGQRWVASTSPMPWISSWFMYSYSSCTARLPPCSLLTEASTSAGCSCGRSCNT